MRRRSRWEVERLEPRSLLSSLVSPPVAAPSGLSIVLSTNQTDYAVGQPVAMTLTETNTGTKPVNVGEGPSIDGFYVTQDGNPVWRSNAGPQPLYIVLKTLQPGQSLMLTATWNGKANEGGVGTPTGLLVVHSQVPGANTVTIQVGNSATAASPIQLTVNTDKSVYKPGQPVQITSTETNVSNQAVTINVFGDSPQSAVISRKGVDVWRYPPNVLDPSGTVVLQPGQSYQSAVTWNGKFNEHLHQPKTGTFVIEVNGGAADGSTKIQIAK